MRTLNQGDEDDTYASFYKSIRLACTAINSLNGYRVKNQQGHHYLTIEVAAQLMNGELKEIFEKIRRMRVKRNNVDYDFFNVSKEELLNAEKYAEAILKKVYSLINADKKQQGLL